MRRFLYSLLLLASLALPSTARAAVGAPFNTTAWARESAGTTLDITMTIAGGHSDRYLHCWVVWIGATTVSGINWDQTGTPEALASKVSILDWGAASANHSEGWGKVNPTAGAAKTVRITMSGISDVMGSCAVFDGVDGTTPTSNRASNTDGSPLVVTSANGDATSTATGTSNTVSSTASPAVLIALGSFVLDIGDDYGLATTTTFTHTWTETGMFQSVLGIRINQVAAGGGSPPPTGSLNLGGAGR